MKIKQISFTSIIIIFYFLFTLFSLLGNFLIDYRSISLITTVLYLLFIFSLVFGSIIGNCIPIFKFRKFWNIDVYKGLLMLACITFITTLIGWVYIIKYYESLAFIFAHGTKIRNETIGNGIQLIPTSISYISSFAHVGPALSLAGYFYSKKVKYIWLTIAFFIINALGDLQTFGRVSMLFCIFNIISYFIICVKKIPYFKVFIYGAIVLIIFMLPKFIRAGNTFDGIGSAYASYLICDVNSAFEPLITIYTYYFSGIYAFDYLIEHFDYSYSYGLRNLSAFFNLLNRIFEFQAERNIIIADDAYVPFHTNIYTLAGELFMDGGVIGILIGSTSFGLISSYLYKYKGFFGVALKIILISWLFETPLYNIFSFGGFLISFIILVLLTFFCNAK